MFSGAFLPTHTTPTQPTRSYGKKGKHVTLPNFRMRDISNGCHHFVVTKFPSDECAVLLGFLPSPCSCLRWYLGVRELSMSSWEQEGVVTVGTSGVWGGQVVLACALTGRMSSLTTKYARSQRFHVLYSSSRSLQPHSSTQHTCISWRTVGTCEPQQATCCAQKQHSLRCIFFQALMPSCSSHTKKVVTLMVAPQAVP